MMLESEKILLEEHYQKERDRLSGIYKLRFTDRDKYWEEWDKWFIERAGLTFREYYDTHIKPGEIEKKEKEERRIRLKKMNTEEILKECTVDGNLVRLPEGQLDRKVYMQVAKKLELIGGKWKGGKVQAFVFPEDPTELLEQIQNGENRNLKKEFQFFETPDELADMLVELAEIKPEHYVLEPEAGRGVIIRAILRKHPGTMVNYYELMDINRTFLDKIPEAHYMGDDFLKHDTDLKFERIIANPPFSKNQDIDHVMKMWDCLKPGGRIVSVTSKHWEHSNNKKETAFREFLDEHNASIIDIEEGAFKSSGTMVGGKIIVIDKEKDLHELEDKIKNIVRDRQELKKIINNAVDRSLEFSSDSEHDFREVLINELTEHLC